MMLADFSRYPNIDKDVAKALGECGVVDFGGFGRETIRSNSFPIDIPLRASVISFMDSSISERQLKRTRWQEVDDRGIEFQRFRVKEFVNKTPTTYFTNSNLISQQRAILVPNELRGPSFSPLQSLIEGVVWR
ncbi:MAG: hypothetical protein ABJJ37_02030, partial [Roseibium sp.]